MKKIKVLQMPIANARGGITQYALENWRLINKDRFIFDFATREKCLDFEDDLIAQGCKEHHLSCSSVENENLFVEEMGKILDEGYDVVHLHTSYWKGILVEKLAMERGVAKVSVHSHNAGIGILDNNARQHTQKVHEQLKREFSTKDATHFTA